jgi:hypothetical protein
MRYLLGAILLLTPILIAACETDKTANPNAPVRAASQPGPMDRVTNPLNPIRANPSGPMRP